MFFYIGAPSRINELAFVPPDLSVLKKHIEIAVVDDEPFVRLEPLRAHGFRLTELGGDIRTLDQVAIYPIVVCDIKGVGRAFGSKFEGAHVVAELHKAYPDKFLVAYTGVTYDPSYNETLAAADGVLAKDAPIEQWTQLLERGVTSAGNPTTRWTRLRNQLLERGVDLFDVLKLEQAFIHAMRSRNSSLLANEANKLHFPNELKELIAKFSGVALAQLIEHFILK